MFPARRRPRRLLRPATVVFLACVSAMGHTHALGQSADSTVTLRRAEYQALLREDSAAARALSAQNAVFDSAVADFERTRSRGNGGETDQAFARARNLVDPTRALTRDAEEASQQLQVARGALIAAILARLGELETQMRAATGEQQRLDSLVSISKDLLAERHELEAEESDLSSRPLAFPDITYDPRDTREELRQKAESLERRAAVIDTLILATDEKIRDYTDRLRQERQIADFLAGTRIFGDIETPVLGGGRGGDQRGAVADSTGVGAQRSLEDRIADLKVFKSELEERKNRALIQAEGFRRRLGGGS